MTTAIDSTGATFDTLAEAKADVITKFKESFGENIKTDDQSGFGIFANIIAEMLFDLGEDARAVINARNPLTASGTHLSNVVQFNGISRSVARYSTVALTVTANAAGTTIPAGSLVQDPNDASVEFAVDTPTTLAPSASASISATATVAGAINADASTLTKIVNPVYGWASVTNAAAAVPGAAVEPDTTLRTRRKYVSRRAGNQSVPAIYRALSTVDSIGRLSIYENKTSLTDSYGQIGHSVWAICQGGTDADIAETLYNSVSGGIYTHGSTTVAHTDTESGKSYNIKFSRVTEVPIKVYLKIRKLSTFPSDGETQIEDALIDYFNGAFVMSDGETNNGFEIGETVEYFRLLTAVNSIGGFTINQFTVAKTTGTLATSDISMARTELATLIRANINIDAY